MAAMRIPLILLCTLAFAVAGCAEGSDEEDGAADPSPSGTTSLTGTGMPPAAQTHEVSLEGNAFVPADLTINRGDTVHWTHNDGNSPHNVESSDPAFDSNPDCTIAIPASPACMTDGDDYSFKFDEAGTVEYRCQVHSGMTATLTVVDPATA